MRKQQTRVLEQLCEAVDVEMIDAAVEVPGQAHFVFW